MIEENNRTPGIARQAAEPIDEAAHLAAVVLVATVDCDNGVDDQE